MVPGHSRVAARHALRGVIVQVVQTGAATGIPVGTLDSRRSVEGIRVWGRARRCLRSRALPCDHRRWPFAAAERARPARGAGCRAGGGARAPQLPGDQVVAPAAGADLLAAQPPRHAVLALPRSRPTPCALDGGDGICVPGASRAACWLRATCRLRRGTAVARVVRVVDGRRVRAARLKHAESARARSSSYSACASGGAASVASRGAAPAAKNRPRIRTGAPRPSAAATAPAFR